MPATTDHVGHGTPKDSEKGPYAVTRFLRLET